MDLSIQTPGLLLLFLLLVTARLAPFDRCTAVVAAAPSTASEAGHARLPAAPAASFCASTRYVQACSLALLSTALVFWLCAASQRLFSQRICCCFLSGRPSEALSAASATAAFLTCSNLNVI